MNNYDTEGGLNGPQRARNGSPIFYSLLEEMAETHDRKSHDYTESSSPFANYEFAGTLASMFSHSSIDAGFVGRLGEKIYRLYVLEGQHKIPLNESIADTERDIAVIATLWMAARKEARQKGEYGLGERYPGPPNAMGCDEKGILQKHTCIKDDGGTPNRICYACHEEKKAAEEVKATPAADKGSTYLRARIDREMSRAEKLELLSYLIKTL